MTETFESAPGFAPGLPAGLTPENLMALINMASGQTSTFEDTHMYWRKDDGNITISYTDEFSRLRNEKQDWEALEEYGQFQLYGYTTDHPYEALFQRGGAHEMLVSQIREEGFDSNPPLVPTCGMMPGQRTILGKPHLHSGKPDRKTGCWKGAKPVVFPQLDGKAPPIAECQFCNDEFPTKKALGQHVRVMHADQTQAIAFKEAITAAMDRGLSRVARETHSGDYVCGRCDASFQAPVALTRHLKECRVSDNYTLADELEDESELGVSPTGE